MRRLALIAMLCLLAGLTFAVPDFAETKALADQGITYAQYNLGAMYDLGEGVTLDYAEAVKWYRRAADQGLPEAQHNLGVMYAKGEGVPQDYAEAYVWSSLAAASGYESAIKHLDAIAQSISPEALSVAKKRAAKLLKKIKKRELRIKRDYFSRER